MVTIKPGDIIQWLDTNNVRSNSSHHNIGVGRKTKVLRSGPNKYDPNNTVRPFALPWEGCCDNPNCNPHMTFRYGIDYIKVNNLVNIPKESI